MTVRKSVPGSIRRALLALLGVAAAFPAQALTESDSTTGAGTEMLAAGVFTSPRHNGQVADVANATLAANAAQRANRRVCSCGKDTQTALGPERYDSG